MKSSNSFHPSKAFKSFMVDNFHPYILCNGFTMPATLCFMFLEGLIDILTSPESYLVSM